MELSGRAGSDRVDGDGGRDRLIGGDGKDKLVDDRDGKDRMRDWEIADEIRLEGAGESDVDIGSKDGDAATTMVVKDEAGDIGWGDIDFA